MSTPRVLTSYASEDLVRATGTFDSHSTTQGRSKRCGTKGCGDSGPARAGVRNSVHCAARRDRGAGLCPFGEESVLCDDPNGGEVLDHVSRPDGLPVHDGEE